MRLCSSTQPISMTRLPSLGLRPVVSVSRTIWRMGQSQWFGVAAAQYSKRRADAQSLPLTESTPRLASTSARSLPGWPLWPRTQRQSTWWTAWAASSDFHKSSFLTGSLAAVFQPRAFQPCIHSLMPFCTYWLSVCSTTAHGRLSALSASMTSCNSMRLLVVFSAPPKISFSAPSATISAPQPPTPGLPLHAPSVKISTLSILLFPPFVGDRYARGRLRRFFGPCRTDEMHAFDALDRLHDVDGAQIGPPARARIIHEGAAVQPFFCAAGRRVAAQVALAGAHIQ